MKILTQIPVNKCIPTHRVKNDKSLVCRILLFMGSHNRLNLLGQTFNYLKVIEEAGTDNQGSLWKCLCKCGNEVIVRGKQLKFGSTKSCGCYKNELIRARSLTHGHHIGRKMSPEYQAWRHMKSRCYNPNVERYPHYGGRGIKVCDRWVDSFEAFLEDMGLRPTPLHSLERKEVNEDYCPGNCIWATREEQANNKRNSHFIEYKGIRKTIAQMAAHFNISQNLLGSRINSGWSVEKAIETPIDKTKRSFKYKKTNQI